jgi:hypothetical protein
VRGQVRVASFVIPTRRGWAVASCLRHRWSLARAPPGVKLHYHVVTVRSVRIRALTAEPSAVPEARLSGCGRL